MPIRIGIQKNADHHPQRKRQHPKSTCSVAFLKRRQLHQRNRIQNKVNWARIRDPIGHINWQEKLLSSIQFPIEIRYPGIPTLLTARGNQTNTNTSTED